MSEERNPVARNITMLYVFVKLQLYTHIVSLKGYYLRYPLVFRAREDFLPTLFVLWKF
jgi:hypothetical protein